jgi:hypothetical protein
MFNDKLYNICQIKIYRFRLILKITPKGKFAPAPKHHIKKEHRQKCGKALGILNLRNRWR